MSSQQKLIIADFEKEQLNNHQERQKLCKSTKIFNVKNILHESERNTSSSKSKFDIKKFEQNILKQILSKHQNSSQKSDRSNKKQNKNLMSHMNTYKLINDQRKLSKSKNKSKKQISLKRLSQQKDIQLKSQANNTKILRQKLLNNLTIFDDYQMINIQDSIPILNQAQILKILTSLEQTKTKIQSKHLPEGRIKEEAKFIYFLWKMINEEYITTRHLKEIIILLNQLSKNDLVDTLSELYVREGEIVKMFVECWMKLKLDKFYYEVSSSKQKFNSVRGLSSSKKITETAYKQSDMQKTMQRPQKQRCKTQYYESDKSGNPDSNEQNFNHIKFLHPQQEKQLIQRLYEDRKDMMNKRQRIKTMNDEEKQNKQLKKCTFKPELTVSLHHTRSSSRSNLLLKTRQNEIMNKNQISNRSNQNKRQSRQRSSSQVKGFEKAVGRMKNGQSQTKLKQQLLAYHSIGENYEKIKQKPINPPKFLSRQKLKKEDLVLFVIQFEIGRHKVKVKMHPTDTQMSVSKKISKIYGLKPDEQEEIRNIVSMELNNYYKKINEQVSEFIQN